MIQSRVYRSYQLSVMHSGHQEPADGHSRVGSKRTGLFRFLNARRWIRPLLYLSAFILPILIDSFISGSSVGSMPVWAPSYIGGFLVLVFMVRIHRYKIKWMRHQDKPTVNWLTGLSWLFIATGYAPWAIDRLASLLLSSYATANTYQLLATTVYLVFLLSVSLAVSQLSLLRDKLNEKHLTIRTTQIALANAEAGKYFLRNMLDLLYAQRFHSETSHYLQLLHRLQCMTRNLLNYRPEQPVELGIELELIHTYIELQANCPGVTTHIEADIPPFAERGCLAPFMNMILLEQAFSRTASVEQKGEVLVSINITDGNLNFHVVNISSTAPGPISNKNSGIESLMQRLELIYPRNHKLEIFEQGKTYSATLSIPLQFQSDSHEHQSHRN